MVLGHHKPCCFGRRACVGPHHVFINSVLTELTTSDDVCIPTKCWKLFVNAPNISTHLPVAFMIPPRKAGRNWIWTFHTGLYRQRIWEWTRKSKMGQTARHSQHVPTWSNYGWKIGGETRTLTLKQSSLGLKADPATNNHPGVSQAGGASMCAVPRMDVRLRVSSAILVGGR